MGELVQLPPGSLVQDKWVVQKKLGEGAFGAVYKVANDKNDIFALKVEGIHEQIQLLKMEVHILAELAKAGGRHFCRMEDKGQTKEYNYVVMTFVGASLADLKAMAQGKKFTFGTAIGVAIQALQALEDLHGIGYLHRDVKPGNYTIGRAVMHELRKVYVLDFGMARKFVHDDGTIKQPRAAAGFRGTVKYAPMACHNQREQCRLDDCETWLYMIVELTKGSLPWRNIKDMNEIGQAKRNCRMTELGRKQLFGGCPREYIDIMRTIDGGKFFDEPNYSRMYYLCRQAYTSTGTKEFPYDWEEFLQKKYEEEKKNPPKILKAGEKAPEEKKKEKKKDEDKKKDDDKKKDTSEDEDEKEKEEKKEKKRKDKKKEDEEDEKEETKEKEKKKKKKEDDEEEKEKEKKKKKKDDDDDDKKEKKKEKKKDKKKDDDDKKEDDEKEKDKDDDDDKKNKKKDKKKKKDDDDKD